MVYDEILNSKFAEPATVISYSGGEIKILAVNRKLLPELWMNISEQDYIEADIHDSFDDENLNIYIKAIEKCISTDEEQECETWRSLVSNCCGFDRICLKSRFILLQKFSDSAIVYEAVRNITNEKRTQDTLADIEHRYKSASEQINIYNWEYNIANKEMRPCYRCMRDLGLPAVVVNYPEPAIDMGIFPPEYADMYREIMRKIDSGVKELEVDIPLTVGHIPFRIKYTTEFDSEGRPIKAFGSATLISETELGHIRVDNQIIASLAEEYSSIYLLDLINDTVNIVKESDIFSLDVNAGCSGLAAQLVSKIAEAGSDGADTLPTRSSEDNSQLKLFADVNKLRNELFNDSNKRELLYKDEQTGEWIRIDYHVIDRGVSGIDRLLITASVLDDLSAQKMDADRLIAAQKAELEDRQVMLQNAIAEANRANEAKTVFFSNMSHDIRTPMSAITGFSKLAKEDIDNRERLTEYLDKIIIAGEHLLNLINDILDMSRIESGKMELALTPVKLKDLITDCTDMICQKTEDKGIKFEVDIAGIGEDLVQCDKLRFRQIMLNLLSNAYKFTPEGQSISVSASLTDRSDKLKYEIHVKDTGIGMSKEFSEQIWDAFSREKNAFVNETQGTGLGMAIVRNIVNMMQGTIELKTELGKGSEFIIILPLEPAIESENTEAQEDKTTCDALNRRYDGKKILVVDDTEMNLKLAQYELEKFGFSVMLSNSGVEAIETVKDSKPGDIDLILMDVLMPVMDGLEATRRIRALKDPALAAIPIVAMTANAFAADIQAVLDAGMNAHVPKPFEEKDLISKISANLR
ncbi:MAG: response regulator [Lachnospiraceae bacterium]|nr:response regulator [Lachnospiraceae bacterium]